MKVLRQRVHFDSRGTFAENYPTCYFEMMKGVTSHSTIYGITKVVKEKTSIQHVKLIFFFYHNLLVISKQSSSNSPTRSLTQTGLTKGKSYKDLS